MKGIKITKDGIVFNEVLPFTNGFIGDRKRIPCLKAHEYMAIEATIKDEYNVLLYAGHIYEWEVIDHETKNGNR